MSVCSRCGLENVSRQQGSDVGRADLGSRGPDVRYTTRVKIGLIDTVRIDHLAERAGMVVVVLLFVGLLRCKVG